MPSNETARQDGEDGEDGEEAVVDTHDLCIF
jgi:hypothetical protein